MVARDLHDDMVVTADGWDSGQPVRILHAHTSADGVNVRWQDIGAHGRAHQVTVDAGFQVDLHTGGQR